MTVTRGHFFTFRETRRALKWMSCGVLFVHFFFCKRIATRDVSINDLFFLGQ